MKKIFIYFMFISLFCYQNDLFPQDAAATGISRAFNPAISVNSLFAGMASSRTAPIWLEMGLDPKLQYQEICLEMTSNVDVYLQSKAAFSAEENEGVNVEEAYVTTLRLPVILRAGKMFNTFGQQNLYHLHHMPFAEPPMILKQVFGHNLHEVGVEASYLVPLHWFSDITAGILNGDNAYLFNSDRQSDLGYLFHIDNLWDLSDEFAFRFGGSYLTGKSGQEIPDGLWTDLKNQRMLSRTWGIDFHLKWKPLQYSRYRSFILQGEYVNASMAAKGRSTQALQGFFIQALRQFKLRWWLQARYDWFKRPDELRAFFPEPVQSDSNPGHDLTGKRASLAIAFVPTEFSAFRIQYNYIDLSGKKEQQLIVQMNITIGSHPAHKY